MNSLEVFNCFVSSVYLSRNPEFLQNVRTVVNDIVPDKSQCVMYHSEDLSQDIRLTEFATYIAKTGWKILDDQGYHMNDKHVVFESMWCQQYKKNTYMPQHVHPNGGTQLVGFYFIECPKNSPNAVLHDPRAGKVQIGLMESNTAEITHGSNSVQFVPEPGMLLFTNSWLPHSFTQNLSTKLFKFIHFNIGVVDATPVCNLDEVEII